MKKAIFKDCNGSNVFAGDRIKIIHDYNYQFRNGKEAIVEWDESKGMYLYRIDEDTSSNNFNGIHKFIKL